MSAAVRHHSQNGRNTNVTSVATIWFVIKSSRSAWPLKIQKQVASN